jgi:hypothetical protein
MTIIDTMTSLIAAKDIRAFEIEGDCDCDKECQASCQ